MERASIDEAYMDLTEEAARLCLETEAGKGEDVADAPETDLQVWGGMRSIDGTTKYHNSAARHLTYPLFLICATSKRRVRSPVALTREIYRVSLELRGNIYFSLLRWYNVVVFCRRHLTLPLPPVGYGWTPH